jgi:DNA-binding MarR family transcriptional regulator
MNREREVEETRLTEEPLAAIKESRRGSGGSAKLAQFLAATDKVGLRTTQYSLLRWLRHAGEVRQRDLGALTSLDETTLTRNLRPLIDAGWVAIRPGEDRREKLVSLTDAGAAKLREARPAWERAQQRLRSRLPEGTWSRLMDLLPELTRLADTA